MKLFLTATVVGIASLFTAGSAKAQPILIPHTTTHYDVVPHRGHTHVVPHTTTHFHAVPSRGYWRGSVWVPYGRPHVDLVPHRGHYHAVPHVGGHGHHDHGHGPVRYPR